MADGNPEAGKSVVQRILRNTGQTENGERESLKEARPAIFTPMLDVVLKDGRISSFNYAYLRQVDFEPGDTLTLRFADGVKVTLVGRNLGEHRQQIRLHRADKICEGTEAEETLKPQHEPHISAIEISEEQEETRDIGKRKGLVR